MIIPRRVIDSRAKLFFYLHTARARVKFSFLFVQSRKHRRRRRAFGYVHSRASTSICATSIEPMQNHYKQIMINLAPLPEEQRFAEDFATALR